MYYFEDIINEIEKEIAGEIDVCRLAKMANMSVYEFRRIFSFVTKVSFGEYVRKRRLSLAALELFEGADNITELSARYGYDSPSSFSRAFREYHGVSPTEVKNGNSSFRLLTKISAEIVTSGGRNIEYSICKKDAFSIGGFCGVSEMSDTECCEDVWSGFYQSEISEKIPKNSRIFAAYGNNGDSVKCIIGTPEGDFAEKIHIPASEWACFKLRGAEDEYVNKRYKEILGEWFASSGYSKREGVPNVEVFPADMDGNDFEWEIWMPIEKV